MRFFTNHGEATSKGNQEKENPPPDRLQLFSRIPCVEKEDRPAQEEPRDEGVVFRACSQSHADGGEKKPFHIFIAAVPPSEIGKDTGRREKDHPEIHVGRDGQAHHHGSAREQEQAEHPPYLSRLILQGCINQGSRAQSEKQVDERGHKIVAEQKWNEVQQVDVHREVAERGPGRLEESPVMDPELRDGQMMDERIAGDGRRQAEEDLDDEDPRYGGHHRPAEKPGRRGARVLLAAEIRVLPCFVNHGSA